MKLIPLSKNGKNKGKYFAKVDDEDYDNLMRFNWYARFDKHNKSFYAYKKERGSDGKDKTIGMHVFIARPSLGELVDHSDLDTLNNQRYNLRRCSKRQNNANTKSRKNSSSKYLGVEWYSQTNKWRSRISNNGKSMHIGYFSNEDDAAKAYDLKAADIHGEFANLNFKNHLASYTGEETKKKEGE